MDFREVHDEDGRYGMDVDVYGAGDVDDDTGAGDWLVISRPLYKSIQNIKKEKGEWS